MFFSLIWPSQLTTITKITNINVDDNDDNRRSRTFVFFVFPIYINILFCASLLVLCNFVIKLFVNYLMYFYFFLIVFFFSNECVVYCMLLAKFVVEVDWNLIWCVGVTSFDRLKCARETIAHNSIFDEEHYAWLSLNTATNCNPFSQIMR